MILKLLISSHGKNRKFQLLISSHGKNKKFQLLISSQLLINSCGNMTDHPNSLSDHVEKAWNIFNSTSLPVGRGRDGPAPHQFMREEDGTFCPFHQTV
jgi:hypothetical protein